MMILKLTRSIFVLFVIMLTCNSCDQSPTLTSNNTGFVDPYIGSGGHGHVFVGASVPFGAVQLGPNNKKQGWDWCSGYHYSDSLLIGFSHTHLSGTGCPDLGDILLMPYNGKIKTERGEQENLTVSYAARYNHQDEQVSPGYYSVYIKKYGIKAELSSTNRVGIHKYTFSKTNEAHVIIDLKEGNGDRSYKTHLKLVDEYTIEGYRFSHGWASDQQIYFTLKSNQPIANLDVFNDNEQKKGTELTAEAVKGVITFSKVPREVILKVGISPVSCANALANIKAEVPGWNFKQVVDQAVFAWNKELGKIVVTDKDTAKLRMFYTALYHAFMAPATYNDHDGSYRGTDKKVYNKAEFTNYTVFSLWDTYRAEQPLLTIVEPERVSDFVESMLAIYQQQGKLPIWPLMGNETNCMVGYSAVPVIADAYLKGFKGFCPEYAFEAMKTSSMRNDLGLYYLKTKGYIPADKEGESVSKALEYCISDWCIAQVAKSLGKDADYDYYLKRAGSYAEYFDSKTGFMRPKMDDGSFLTPFDPIKSGGNYTEGNGWQYTWLVPEDVEGLIKLFGGEKPFCAKLDSLFSVTQDLGDHVPDISGLIGMYAHGNEPSHHVAYLYAYAGQQWKTAEKVRYIMKRMYSDLPDGLCGNEDCGQMSAWYILSSLGFYPVNPVNGIYVFGSPNIEKAIIDLPEGKTFIINAKNNSDENIFIQSVLLNGKSYTHSYITYKDIMAGGVLEFVMGNKPNKKFGSDPDNRPHSLFLSGLAMDQ